MRLGIFGGTFDPVHLGHLILAEQCRDQARLDQVLFVVAARPPHKLDQELTPFDKRVEMLNLALAGNPAFRVEELEKEREGPSYTVDTLRIIQERDAEAELHLIIGSDSLNDLPLWYEPVEIVRRAIVLIVVRPGWPEPPPGDLARQLNLPDREVRLEVVQCPQVGISSRDLRRRVAEGRSIRYLVPRAVEAYVAEKKLYL